MKNNGFDSVFGNQDRGYRNLIESQAKMEKRLDVKESSKVKKMTKTIYKPKHINRKNG